MAKEYPKLLKTIDYDVDAARELAEAMNERYALMQRVQELTQVIDENDELKPFVWTTADGKSAAHADLSTDHVANIMSWHVENGRTLSKQIISEARRRKLAVPRQPKKATTIQGLAFRYVRDMSLSRDRSLYLDSGDIS